jgi:hypothetical protein
MARPAGTKNIESPEKMLEYFEAYKTEVKSKPFLVKDWVGKDGDEVYREKEKPLTMEGFEVYCFKNDIITDLSDYFENKQERYSDYVHICRVIKKTIREDQITGGMAMVYNPSITQRLNNLVEKTESQVQATITQVTPQVINTGAKLSNSESEVEA